MAKCFSKKYGNKGRASTTCNLKVMLRCLSAPDATSLHCLKKKQPKFICFYGKYPSIYLVLCTVEEGVANTCI